MPGPIRPGNARKPSAVRYAPGGGTNRLSRYSPDYRWSDVSTLPSCCQDSRPERAAPLSLGRPNAAGCSERGRRCIEAWGFFVPDELHAFRHLNQPSARLPAAPLDRRSVGRHFGNVTETILYRRPDRARTLEDFAPGRSQVNPLVEPDASSTLASRHERCRGLPKRALRGLDSSSLDRELLRHGRARWGTAKLDARSYRPIMADVGLVARRPIAKAQRALLD